ncbi:MAG: ATP-binding protein [Myxococcaceae bacterium]
MVNRLLSLELLSPGQSCFLLGPRGTGKTFLVESFLAAGVARESFASINLLEEDTFTRYVARPSRMREELEQQLTRHPTPFTVFIDEVQRIPALLNEVHSLIERYKGRIRFILTGSSARKLKRAKANLLGGRAWNFHLHPLTHRESVDSLERALHLGTLPAVYLDANSPERTLRAYVQTYLKEEIREEALVRRVDAFVRFLDVAAQANGEPINFTKVGLDCGVSTKTAQEYFSILEDTLIVHRLDGWSRSARKQLTQQPKFYWFDNGVLNSVRGELSDAPREGSSRFGSLFETWVIQEMIRLNDYQETDFRFHHWRTNTNMEVDIVVSKNGLNPLYGIEIKSGTSPRLEDVKGLLSFQTDFPQAKLFCFCRAPQAYRLEAVEFLPWREGLKRLFPHGDEDTAEKQTAQQRRQ